jgi:hypothetical protein
MRERDPRRERARTRAPSARLAVQIRPRVLAELEAIRQLDPTPMRPGEVRALALEIGTDMLRRAAVEKRGAGPRTWFYGWRAPGADGE